MIEVKSKLQIYEVNGRKVDTLPTDMDTKFNIRSHGSQNRLVVLEILDLDGKNLSLSVSANDLKAAIDNATNTRRHVQ